MSTQLEHANMIVANIDTVAGFIQTAFPDFAIRARGDGNGRRWLHVGNADNYVALTEASSDAAEPWVPYSGKPGLNHLGFKVDDVASVRARLRDAGYKESTLKNNHPHRRRVYFMDPVGNDWEFVEYFSDDPAKRNDYALPDWSRDRQGD